MLDRVWAVRAGGRGALRAVALVPILLGLMSCSSDEQSAPAREPSQQPGATGKGSNPLLGGALYVDPQSPAALQARRWREQGRAADAAAMARLAKRPTAVWLADGADVVARVRETTRKASDAQR